MKITKIKKTECGEGIFCEFEHNRKKGDFIYSFFGENEGILDCNFKEGENEDIFQIIHNWVKKHIKIKQEIKYDGKKLK